MGSNPMLSLHGITLTSSNAARNLGVDFDQDICILTIRALALPRIVFRTCQDVDLSL